MGGRGGEGSGDLTLPPHQLAGVSEVQILGPATLAMEHFLADKVTTLRVAVRDVRGEGGLAGPAGVPLDDELGVEVGVRPDLLHHHGAPLTAQLHRPAELPALLCEVKLDICRISVSVGLSGSRGGKYLTNLHVSLVLLLLNVWIHFYRTEAQICI